MSQMLSMPNAMRLTLSLAQADIGMASGYTPDVIGV
ncbi:hypothetical protein NKDENANG_00324 [Candidatus Entotheonellaceae bacterium PAL068K]